MSKFVGFIKKHREGLSYMAFGVLTTLSSMAVYELTFIAGRYWFNVDMTDVDSIPYLVLYFTAQVLQWVTAVLVAFSTNRKWVFLKADKRKGTFWPQLLKFSATRLATFGLDLVMTYLLIGLLTAVLSAPEWSIPLFGRVFVINAELIAKIISSIIVVILNYFISKGFVFKKAKNAKPEEQPAQPEEPLPDSPETHTDSTDESGNNE